MIGCRNPHQIPKTTLRSRAAMPESPPMALPLPGHAAYIQPHSTIPMIRSTCLAAVLALGALTFDATAQQPAAPAAPQAPAPAAAAPAAPHPSPAAFRRFKT